jgi:hypothetical protein
MPQQGSSKALLILTIKMSDSMAQLKPLVISTPSEEPNLNF